MAGLTDRKDRRRKRQAPTNHSAAPNKAARRTATSLPGGQRSGALPSQPATTGVGDAWPAADQRAAVGVHYTHKLGSPLKPKGKNGWGGRGGIVHDVKKTLGLTIGVFMIASVLDGMAGSTYDGIPYDCRAGKVGGGRHLTLTSAATMAKPSSTWSSFTVSLGQFSCTTRCCRTLQEGVARSG